jgi:hypothetical protein
MRFEIAVKPVEKQSWRAAAMGAMLPVYVSQKEHSDPETVFIVQLRLVGIETFESV